MKLIVVGRAAAEVGRLAARRSALTVSVVADPVEAATQLADVALWLLDAEPASVYALACEVAGPPLLKVNVLAARGELASLEATVDAEGFPARRDLHLLATDGEITHRTGQDDL